MGMSTQPVMFINFTASIHVVETTESDLISKDVTIQQFAGDQSTTVDRIISANHQQDVGMLIVKRSDGKFMSGHLV